MNAEQLTGLRMAAAVRPLTQTEVAELFEHIEVQRIMLDSGALMSDYREAENEEQLRLMRLFLWCVARTMGTHIEISAHEIQDMSLSRLRQLRVESAEQFHNGNLKLMIREPR